MWFPKIGEKYYRTSFPSFANTRGNGSEDDQYWATQAALGHIVKTQEEAQRIHDEAAEKARKALKPEPWRPTEQGRAYFFALMSDRVARTIYEPENATDRRLIKAGNCFETEADCCECIQAQRKVRDEIQLEQAKRKAESVKAKAQLSFEKIDR